MAAIERESRPIPEGPKHPAEAPFAVWPDPGAGYRVMDLRSQTWATGPQRTLAEAFEAMHRLNRQAALGRDLAPLCE